jgi:hypothetical protein
MSKQYVKGVTALKQLINTSNLRISNPYVDYAVTELSSGEESHSVIVRVKFDGKMRYFNCDVFNEADVIDLFINWLNDLKNK